MGREPPEFDSRVRSYYETSPEEDRLSKGPSQIEAERTRILVTRHAPAPPAVVIDVGGAAGAYAFWMASAGYEVHLVDPVPRLVEVATARNEKADHPLVSAQVGDARALDFPSASADIVLMLGPLYHLTAPDDRRMALAEAARVLKPGGCLFAVCITRWASLLDGLSHDYLSDPDFVAMMNQDLKTGQHRNPGSRPGYFTTAYFHTPDEFEAELRGSGLELQGLFGLEGAAFLLSDFEDRWSDPRTRADLLRVAEEIEAEPSLRGLSPHLLGVCRKREGA